MSTVQIDTKNHDAQPTAVKYTRLKGTLLEEWSREAAGRPLTIVMVGKSGVGKSTLINNFLELEKDDMCPTGDGASTTTTKIEMIETEKESMLIRVFDTPGLGGIGEIKMADVFKHLIKRTDRKLDILVYCTSMHPSASIDSADVEIIRAISSAFGPEIWLRTILALTFADSFKDNLSMEYEAHICDYAESFQKALHKAGLDIAVQSVFSKEAEPCCIPVIPVGSSIVELSHISTWRSQLFTEALRKSNPMLMLEIKKSSCKLQAAEFGGSVMAGVAVGAAVGTAIGAPFMGIGIIVGPAAGAVVGGAVGSVIPIILHTIQKRRKCRSAARQK